MIYTFDKNELFELELKDWDLLNKFIKQSEWLRPPDQRVLVKNFKIDYLGFCSKNEEWIPCTISAPCVIEIETVTIKKDIEREIIFVDDYDIAIAKAERSMAKFIDKSKGYVVIPIANVKSFIEENATEEEIRKAENFVNEENKHKREISEKEENGYFWISVERIRVFK